LEFWRTRCLPRKKPFEGLTDENCLQKIVIDKEKPQLPKEKEKEYNERHPFVILVKSCWDDDPGNRTPFSKLLEPENGLIHKIKKVPPSGATLSEKLREKLKKKWKEGNEVIQWKDFWEKFESAFGKDNANKALSFIKILLNITEHQQKVIRKDAERICDWLSGADVSWIVDGFRTSIFFKYFVGVFTKEEIEKKYGDITDKNLKCVAILHWDPVKDSFCLSVRKQKGNEITWVQHYLTTKQIGVPLRKEVQKEISIQRYKDASLSLYPTTLFERLKKGDNTGPQLYTKAESASIAPIYVN